MKHPLRSSRVDLVTDGNEWRVTLDGLTKGYVQHHLGGWYWRRLSSGYGDTRTKEEAVKAVLAPKAAPGQEGRDG